MLLGIGSDLVRADPPRAEGSERSDSSRPSTTGGGRVDRRIFVILYGSLLLVSGAWLIALAEQEAPWPGHLPIPWIALVAAFFAAEGTALHVEIRRETHSLSLSGLPLVLGLLSVGPVALILARVLGGGAALAAIRRRGSLKLMWNLALYVLEVGVASVIVLATVGTTGPSSMADWLVVLAAVLAAELIGLVAVPIVIMVAEGERNFALFVQIGRLQVLALLTSIFGVVTAAAMVDAPALGLLALVPVVGVAALLRMHGRLSKEHHDLEQLHDFTTAIAGRDTLDAGLEQLARILRSEFTAVALLDELAPGSGPTPARRPMNDQPAAMASATVRLYRDGVVRDIELSVPAGIAPGSRRGVIPVAANRPLTMPGHLMGLLQARHRARSRADGHESSSESLTEVQPPSTLGLALRLDDVAGGAAYLLVFGRLGASREFTDEEVQLFGSLGTNLGARLSADHLVERLEAQARTDALTGLLNRAALETEMTRRLADPTRRGAVILLDLDRFKDVNDSLGHNIGDQLLQGFARRLRTAIRDVDVASRLGGDEFALLLEDRTFGDGEDLFDRRLADLVRTVNAPIEVEDITLEVASSLGVVRWPDDATTPSELLRLADIAMYEAKRTHQAWVAYEPTIDHANAHRLSLVGQLRDAMAERQLQIHLQPQVDTTSLELVGAEALLRWHHPEQGLVPPGEFIPLAEQSSLAGPITRYVSEEAMRALGVLDAHGAPDHFVISVNLTARDLLDRSLPSVMGHLMVVHGIDPGRLRFEVTEGSLIVDLDAAIGNLKALKGLGSTVSVDDFGTGYASLQYLHRLPVDEVKIDQSFVVDATTNANSASIVRSTARLIRELGMTVVAEGVEDQATLELLREVGCDVAQGFVFSPPLPVEEFAEWGQSYSAAESGTTA